MSEIAPHTRLRPSPFYEVTLPKGVTSFTPYNQMLIPLEYGDVDAEYARLMNGVSMWDAGGKRQFQIKGRDAARLAQILSPRDLSGQMVGQGKYVPMCNHAGTLINDPVVNKLDDDMFWFSIADSDAKLWARCIAAERRLEVDITEPDVSPMAIQGPMAADVVASIFGNWVRNLKYFWFGDAEIGGIPVKISRAGFSKQGGFDIYLMDGSRGAELWNIVREAGTPFGIGPGSPAPCERIESGLLSCGGDSDDATNPFEVRLGKFVDLDVDDDVIGIKALRRIKEEDPKRHQLGLVLDNKIPFSNHARWYDIQFKDRKVGDMTNGTWSRKLGRNIGFALISCSNRPGDRIQVSREGEQFDGVLCELPFR